MKRIVGGSEMKALDGCTITGMGVPSCVLMERAALAVVDAMEGHFAEMLQKQRILCVCGGGNNGGDGVAIARILHLHGYNAEIYMLGNPDHRTKETRRQLKIAENYQVPLVNNLAAGEYTTIVDAIFGVGLDRPIEGKYREVIQALNEVSAWKVAVDLPSGVCSNTGRELGIAFRADLTVTFAFCKTGLCFYPGKSLVGKIVVADVGIYENPDLPARKAALEKKDLQKLPLRAANGNKGTFGKVLVVAGSKGMCGAAYLCAEGAFAAGAGMVKILTDEENRIPLQTLLPEAMFADDAGGNEAWVNAMHWCDIVVIGPGLGQSEKSARKTEFYLAHAQRMGKPVLLDADGERFRSGCEAGPEIVKPNREELLEYAGIARSVSMTKEEESQIIGKTVRDLFEKGVKRIVVSMGKEGALMRERGFAAAAEAIPVEVQSTVGAGDAFAAALAYAWENKLDKKEAFQLGMAVSAGAVTTEGTRPPSLKKVQELLKSLKRAKQ